MPMHDWSQVEPTVYHDFHQTWAMAIRNALNGGLLPPGYSALVEQHAAGLVSDVVALQSRSRRSPRSKPGGGVVVAEAPRTRHMIEIPNDQLRRANRVAIRHRLGDVVCIIEIVSPGNKSSQSSLRAFVEKSADFLNRGVHLLVIDPFPPTPRDPGGIAKAILDEFEPQTFELPVDQPLTLAAFAAADDNAETGLRAYVEPVGVGQSLPDMPAYLEPGGYVPVPLEATYQTAWASCPADMRELVETGRLSNEDELDERS